MIETGVMPQPPPVASVPVAEPEHVRPILTEPEVAPTPVPTRRRTKRRQTQQTTTTEHPTARAPRPPRKRRRRAPRENATPTPNPTPIPVRFIPGPGIDQLEPHAVRVIPRVRTLSELDILLQAEKSRDPEQLALGSARPGSAATENDARAGGARVVSAALERSGEESSPPRIPPTRKPSPKPPMPTGVEAHPDSHGAEPAHAEQLRDTIDRGAEEFGADLIREHTGESDVEPRLPGIPPEGRQGKAARNAMLHHVKPFFVQKRAQVGGAVRKWRRHFRTHRSSIISSIVDSIFFAVAPLAWLRAQGAASARDWRTRPPETPSSKKPGQPPRRRTTGGRASPARVERNPSSTQVPPRSDAQARTPAAPQPTVASATSAPSDQQDQHMPPQSTNPEPHADPRKWLPEQPLAPDAHQAGREAHWEGAVQARLRAIVREGIEAMGQDLIRSHAGNKRAYPALRECPPFAPSGRAAQAALERDLERFLVAEEHHRRPGIMSARKEKQHHRAVERGLKGWRRYLNRHRDRITAEVTAAVWPHYREEMRERKRIARQGAEQRSRPRPMRDLAREHGRDRAPNREPGQGPAPRPRSGPGSGHERG